MQLFFIAILLTAVCAQNVLDDNVDKTFDSETEQTRYVEPTSATIPATPQTEKQIERSCGLGKECVLRELCSADDTILIDLHNLPENSECPSVSETCCSIGNIIVTNVPSVTPTDRPTGCGYGTVGSVNAKIVDPYYSQFGEFPWMLAIMSITNNTGDDALRLFCGGSLIHHRVALTGGHCVYKKSADTMIVRAGEWELFGDNELYPHQDRQVVDIVLHEEYNKNNLRYDIALLFLDSPYELAPNVNTVCLPPVAYDFNAARCYASGWGIGIKLERLRRLLKKVDLPVVPRNECQTLLRETRLGKYFDLHSTFICAGGEKNKDTCQGDGGSPLMCPIENTESRYYQTGIVSWGIGCFDESVPSVYTNVAELRPWIDNNFVNWNISSSYYTE